MNSSLSVLGPVLATNSLCQRQGKRTMRQKMDSKIRSVKIASD